MKIIVVFIICSSLVFSSYGQGPYAPNSESAGTDAIHYESDQFVSWTSDIKLIRGYKDIANKGLGKVNFGEPSDALGKSDMSAVSLGDSGVAYVYFNGWILNKPGADFAVFENSFNHEFLELAFVEVSKDGVNYSRFPAFSETETSSQISSFDLLEASNIKNLAGKYKIQYGTPFDLDDVGIDSVHFIRIVDVVGSIDSTIGSKDSKGRLINDPYPTDFQNNGFYTGGFDLEAIGFINYEGEIFLGGNELVINQPNIEIYPNPAISVVTLSLILKSYVNIQDLNGKSWHKEYIEEGVSSLDVMSLPRGVYTVMVLNEKESFVSKLVLQ